MVNETICYFSLQKLPLVRPLELTPERDHFLNLENILQPHKKIQTYVENTEKYVLAAF